MQEGAPIGSSANLSRRLVAALRRPRLSVVVAVLFAGLSMPILIFILLYHDYMSSMAVNETLRTDVTKSNAASIESTENFIEPVSSMLRLLATAAVDDPAFFRTERSNEFLYQALTAAPQIDATYVSFEDGYHRVVTRMDEDRRRSDRQIPPTANWHSSYIDAFSAGKNRARHRTFYDTWPHVVGQYSVPSTLDIRTLSGYEAAKKSGKLVVTEPTINPDTGGPIISLRYPIVREGEFLGTASANITLGMLSRYLRNHRTSEHSTTVIADPSDGTIIAISVQNKGVRTENGELQVARLANIDDPDLRRADELHRQTGRNAFIFRSPATGVEMSASFDRFPGSFGHPWEVINLTPTDDFVGALKEGYREMLLIIVLLGVLELLLLYFVSTRLARPIENVSEELKTIESMSFEIKPVRRSSIAEIADLQAAAALLRNSLRSFSSFVPLDVVRQLIRSGIPLSLGVEQRHLTIFFSDLEEFSRHAARLAPDALLAQISGYFEEVSRAISEEHGTVDKFIGDGVMAFWGAPEQRPDHVLRACAGALRAARRMEQLNRRWAAEGRPCVRMHIGLHSADVLVGNVGSSERLSYTVMGDGVNVAARLEGMNKAFGTTICISHSIFEAVGQEVVARSMLSACSRGSQPVTALED